MIAGNGNFSIASYRRRENKLSRAHRIESVLKSALQPTHLVLRDDSHRHRGHGGWREEGETHFTLEISAPALSGKTRVAAQQAIYRLLADEFATGLHAFSIKITD